MTKSSLSFILLASLSLSGAAAACGGTPPKGTDLPANPTSSSSAPAPTDSGATPTPSASATTPTPTPSTSATTPPPAAIVMKDPVASAMLADLQKIGLDPKKLQPMAKMAKTDKKKLRQVMDLFVKSTGLKCTECHDGDDYDKPTPRKNVATHMWDEFVIGLTTSSGAPVFCDSCHQGTVKLLDHSDKKALSKWMQTAFVDKLARRDKKDHACATCHGSEMEMDLIDKWKKK
jgi:hypothetical protein